MSPSPDDEPPQIGDAAEFERVAPDPEDAGTLAESEVERRDILPFFHRALGPWPVTSDRKTRMDRQAIEERHLGRSADRLDAIVAKVQMQLDVNREGGAQPIYAGFEFVLVDETPSEEEAPYVGAFLPLRVAAEFPELLLTTTITYDDIYCRDVLACGTRIVVSPGVFHNLPSHQDKDVLGLAAAFCWNLLASTAGRRKGLTNCHDEPPGPPELIYAGEFREGLRRGLK